MKHVMLKSLTRLRLVKSIFLNKIFTTQPSVQGQSQEIFIDNSIINTVIYVDSCLFNK